VLAKAWLRIAPKRVAAWVLMISWICVCLFFDVIYAVIPVIIKCICAGSEIVRYDEQIEVRGPA